METTPVNSDVEMTASAFERREKITAETQSAQRSEEK
jgi:hypothetical protein